MSDDAALLIPIQFSLEEARTALAQFEAAARAAGKATGEGFASESKKGLGGFLQTLQAFKSEQVQQGRQARFFAGEILSILPASDAARGGMEQLLGMFIEGAAGGIGFGLALEGVKLAVSTVTEELKRNEMQLGAVSRAQTQANLLWAQGREDLNALTTSMTEGQKAQRVEAEKLLPKLQAIDEEYRNLREEGPGWVAKMELAFAQGSPGMKQWQARLEQLIEQSKRAKAAFKLFSEAAGDLAGGYEQSAAQEKAYWDLRAADEKAARERAVAARQARAEAMKQVYADAWQMEVEYATKSNALMLQAEEAGLDERAKAELDYQRTIATLRADDTASQVAALVIRNAKLAALDKKDLDERAALVAEFRAEIVAGAEEQKAKEIAIQQQYADFMRDSLVGLASSALSSFKPLLAQSAAYDRAMKAAGLATKSSVDLSAAALAAMTQDFLTNLAIQAGTKSIFEVAEGLASAATGNEGSAAAHFAAAAQYGIVAGVAAAGAVAIGATRGTTRAERDSISSQTATSQGTGVSSGGTRGYGGGSSSGGGTVTIRETVYVIGDAFESPAETARRAARVMQLADRLDMTKRAA